VPEQGGKKTIRIRTWWCYRPLPWISLACQSPCGRKTGRRAVNSSLAVLNWMARASRRVVCIATLRCHQLHGNQRGS